MQLDRRQVLATGGAWLAACGAGARPAAEPTRAEGADALDSVLAASAAVLPEAPGAGANHYPMAAEALDALGRADAIPDAWRTGARGYAGEPGRRGAVEGDATALGDYGRLGDWRDQFDAALAHEPWRDVLARWAPRLAPGLAGATFHGLIRTAHAARALRRRETAARRDELASALAYWAVRHVELPVRAGAPDGSTLAEVAASGLADGADVGFSDVLDPLLATPLAPPVALPAGVAARDALDELLRAAATGLCEMLVQERSRIWLLHTVTGPAAVELLLPEVDEAGARALVAHARQAAFALYAAYGAPYAPRAGVRPAPAAWPALVERAAASGSVHTIKLTEALTRCDRDGDPLWRTVAERFLEWH